MPQNLAHREHAPDGKLNQRHAVIERRELDDHAEQRLFSHREKDSGKIENRGDEERVNGLKLVDVPHPRRRQPNASPKKRFVASISRAGNST